MRPRLLVVDDDAALLRMLEWEMEALGYVVDCAGDCRSGMQCARTRPCDLALLDQGLPDGTGIGLMASLHRLAPGLPVVLFSASAEEPLRAGALQAGAARFLVKPVSAARLDGVFRELLGRGAGDRDRRAGRP